MLRIYSNNTSSDWAYNLWRVEHALEGRLGRPVGQRSHGTPLGYIVIQGERPRAASIEKAKSWELKWGDIHRRFDIKAKPTRWLGFFIDCCFNWQAHVRHRLAFGHYRIKATARVMNANGVQRKLARKVSWAVGMSTAAYGIEAIWEGQQWLLDGVDKLCNHGDRQNS